MRAMEGTQDRRARTICSCVKRCRITESNLKRCDETPSRTELRPVAIYIWAEETYAPGGFAKISAFYCQQRLNSKDQDTCGEKTALSPWKLLACRTVELVEEMVLIRLFNAPLTEILNAFLFFFFPHQSLFFSSTVG